MFCILPNVKMIGLIGLLTCGMCCHCQFARLQACLVSQEVRNAEFSCFQCFYFLTFKCVFFLFSLSFIRWSACLMSIYFFSVCVTIGH